MLFKKKKKDDLPEQIVVGGFSFFLSLTVLIPTGLLTFLMALSTWKLSCLPVTGAFFGGIFLGLVVTAVIVQGRLSVFLHEFKHSLISGLVGNKWKEMKIEENSGHFVYSYTKDTSHYNAFISLAPYCVPILTITMFVIAICLRVDHRYQALIVGAGYGGDILLNWRDISPVQTDITMIRGGYTIGLLYIFAWNLAVLGVLAVWIFHGWAGIGMLIAEFGRFFLSLHNVVNAKPQL